jgi:hypothetical protein
MIIVVGAGIVGSSLSRHLDDRGISHLLISEPNPASEAAFALLRRGYHHGDQLALFDRSLELYRKWNMNVTEGGYVTNYRKPGREARYEEDWHALDPREPLIVPHVSAYAEAHPQGVKVGDGNNAELIKADRVLWATGARHPDAIGVTYGVTWTHPSRSALVTSRLRLHHFAPYKTIACGWIGDLVRLGSSSASSAPAAMEQARKMLLAAHEVGMVTTLSGWTAEVGMRCKDVDQDRENSSFHQPVLGFHRTGYAIAPAATERIVEALA